MKRLAGIVVFLSLAATCAAREVWVVQFRTHFPVDFPDPASPCQTAAYYWQSRLMLSNTTDQELTVSLLSVSNGQRRADARDLTISPRHTVSVEGYDTNWQPDVPETTPAIIWVNQLEIPDGVAVADRGEVFLAEPGSATPLCNFGYTSRAGLTFRVVEQLTPAGVSQYHLGADIGDGDTLATRLDARINVGVFNASSEPAGATVEVRCSSPSKLETRPDELAATLHLAIPPNTLVQQTALPSTAAASCRLHFGTPFFHVIVTSDQPGFSYAAALSNQALPKFPGFSPATN
jgi:hypothetical protein